MLKFRQIFSCLFIYLVNLSNCLLLTSSQLLANSLLICSIRSSIFFKCCSFSSFLPLSNLSLLLLVNFIVFSFRACDFWRMIQFPSECTNPRKSIFSCFMTAFYYRRRLHSPLNFDSSFSNVDIDCTNFLIRRSLSPLFLLTSRTQFRFSVSNLSHSLANSSVENYKTHSAKFLLFSTNATVNLCPFLATIFIFSSDTLFTISQSG